MWLLLQFFLADAGLLFVRGLPVYATCLSRVMDTFQAQLFAPLANSGPAG